MNDELTKHILLNKIIDFMPKKELPDYREKILATLLDGSRRLNESDENDVLKQLLKQKNILGILKNRQNYL